VVEALRGERRARTPPGSSQRSSLGVSCHAGRRRSSAPARHIASDRVWSSLVRAQVLNQRRAV